MKYDHPMQVTQKQYEDVIDQFSGMIAHRIANGKYYIKIWDMRFKHSIQKLLT